MLLFLIGLELRPQRLWAMRMAVFGLGGAQVAATAIILAAILASLTDFRTALLGGLALSLSSTAFVLQMLKERGELDTRHGRLAFAILLFQDIAAIPMIALVGLFSPDGTAAMSPWSALGGLLAIGAIILAGRFLLTRLYRFVAATGLQEAMTATALLTVIVIVIVMNAAGLSAALGAFIAGLVLAESPYRHEIEANIAPFEGLLLGFFFVAVGMSLDLTLLARYPLAIALAVLGLVARQGRRDLAARADHAPEHRRVAPPRPSLVAGRRIRLRADRGGRRRAGDPPHHRQPDRYRGDALHGHHPVSPHAR